MSGFAQTDKVHGLSLPFQGGDFSVTSAGVFSRPNAQPPRGSYACKRVDVTIQRQQVHHCQLFIIHKINNNGQFL